MAVVQMRVDANGRTYSSIVETTIEPQSPSPSTAILVEANTETVQPTSESTPLNHQNHLNNNCKDKLSGPNQEHRSQQHSNDRVIPTINVISPFSSTEMQYECLPPLLKVSMSSNNGLVSGYSIPNGGKFCYCSRRRPMLRSESIKVDNWDYIYTERRLTNER